MSSCLQVAPDRFLAYTQRWAEWPGRLSHPSSRLGRHSHRTLHGGLWRIAQQLRPIPCQPLHGDVCAFWRDGVGAEPLQEHGAPLQPTPDDIGIGADSNGAEAVPDLHLYLL